MLPSTTLKNAGSKFSLIILAITWLVRMGNSLGFNTTVLPAAIAAMAGPKDN